MKGNTKIILTNVETGEVETHENNNMVTAAIDKIINQEMAMNHAPNSNILPIATKALGGIMLFSGRLTENEDNIHFPVEAHLVGYGDQAVNTDDKFRGSYNNVESGPTADGYVSVWDFGTSQGNGTIRAVARTHAIAGACPLYYFLSGEEAVNNGTPATDRSWMPVRYDGEYVYMLKNNRETHTMRMARVKIPVFKQGVGDYNGAARSYEIVASWNTELTSYTYYNNQYDYDDARNPHEQTVYADDPYDYQDGHDGYIYCMFYGPNRSYSTYPYDMTWFTIKYSDGSFERSETYRAQTGLSYYTDTSYDYLYRGHRYRGHVNRGNLYRIRGNRKIIDIIPLNNTAAYQSIRIFPDSVSDYVGTLDMMSPFNGGTYFEVYHYTATSYEMRIGILYPDGIYILIEKSYPGQYWDHGSSGAFTRTRTTDEGLCMWAEGGSDYFYRKWATNYLGTINNLSEEVVKTAAQTMKIIYTLTDVEEEEEEEENEN